MIQHRGALFVLKKALNVFIGGQPGKLAYLLVEKFFGRPKNCTIAAIVLQSGLLILQIGKNPLKGIHEVFPLIQTGLPCLDQ